MQRIHKGLLLACAVVLVILVGSCSGTKNVGTLGNFSAAFTGFTPHIGMKFYLKVVDVANNATIGLSTPADIATDSFNVSIPSIIESGKNYRIDFWVDMDDNGTLDHSPNGTPAGVDHSWRLTGTGTSTGLALTFAHDTNWTDITPF